MKIFNPSTAELIQELPEDNQKTLHSKFNTLKLAQPDWANVALQERIAIITQFSKLLMTDKERLANDLHLETGKLINEAHNEINGACYRIQFFLDHTEKTLKEKTLRESNGIREILSFEPLGIIANISAWNYPFLVGINVFIPALLAGNAVLYKPSEYASLTGLNIEKLLHQAGVPINIFTTVIGDGVIGHQLLNLSLNGYFFTGSYKTGKLIQETVAHKLVPVGLELGGKDPVYVMDDIHDVQQVATSLIEGKFYNNGQSCCAVERIYVHEKIHEDFVDAFVTETKKLPSIPPLARPQQIEVLEDQVQDALNKGARLLLGGRRMKEPGAFFEPTIFTHVNHSMKLMRDESFGPIIGIQKVSG
ncbi:MAG: hypothetical protein ACD_46C00279G0005, partial [uncultured bacterium]